MAVIDRLLNRNKKATPMPTTARPLTLRTLGIAMQSLEGSSLYRDGPAAHTLYAMYDALTLHAARDSEPARVAEGPLPFTLEQLDEALAEVGELELPASTMNTFRRARGLIAKAEEQAAARAAAAPPAFVTRQELDAALTAIGLAVSETVNAARDNFADAARYFTRLEQVTERAPSAVRPFLKRISEAAEGHDHRPYGLDRNKLRLNGANGRNW